MARGYALSHGENLQGNNSSFAKSLALDFEIHMWEPRVLLQWRRLPQEKQQWYSCDEEPQEQQKTPQ